MPSASRSRRPIVTSAPVSAGSLPATDALGVRKFESREDETAGQDLLDEAVFAAVAVGQHEGTYCRGHASSVSPPLALLAPNIPAICAGSAISTALEAQRGGASSKCTRDSGERGRSAERVAKAHATRHGSVGDEPTSGVAVRGLAMDSRARKFVRRRRASAQRGAAGAAKIPIFGTKAAAPPA
jgi:hypothetical protein